MYISNNKAKVVFVMIQHITGISQSAIFFLVYKTLFTGPARFIDAFVESISLQTLGFLFKPLKEKSP
jgi:hypothetical protein